MHNVSINSSATAATKQRSVLRLSLLLVLLLGWCNSGVSRAYIVRYNVSFNDLNAFQFNSGSSPYALDFYLSGSSGTTTITDSNFIGSGTDASTDFMLENSLADADTTRIFTPPTTSPVGSLLSFDITANYNPGNGDAFSLAIYKNFGAPTVTLVSAVATPETWAMMAMGLCSIAVLMKRCKKQENQPMLLEGNLLSQCAQKPFHIF